MALRSGYKMLVYCGQEVMKVCGTEDQISELNLKYITQKCEHLNYSDWLSEVLILQSH